MKKRISLLPVLLTFICGMHFTYAQNGPESFPVAMIEPDTLTAVLNNCNDSVTLPVTVYNYGTAPLLYGITPIKDFFDDFENGMDKWVVTGSWGISNLAYEGSGSLAESPSGNYGNGWDIYATIKDSVTVIYEDSASVSFYIRQLLEGGYDYLYVEISVNGGEYQEVTSYNGYDDNWVFEELDLTSYVNFGDYFRIRLYFHSDGSAYYDGVNIDNFRIKGVGNFVDWLKFTNSSGIVFPGFSSVINFTFYSAGLVTGNYYGMVYIETNDPTNPRIPVHCFLTVNGYPLISVSDTLIDFGPVMKNATKTDTLYVSNSGCDNMVVDSILISHDAFTTLQSPFSLAAGHQKPVLLSFTPETLGPFAAVVTFYSNAGPIAVSLTGTGTPSPVIEVDPDSIYVTLQHCEDTADIPVTIRNTGDGELYLSYSSYDLTIVPPYCQPQTGNTCCDMGIHRIQFNTIDNLTGPGTESYQDYSDTIYTFLKAGTNYPITIQIGNQYAEHVAAWIDFNGNGNFETNERVLYLPAGSYQPIIHSNIVIPQNPSIINKKLRMRICSEYSGYGFPGPCTNLEYGQHEDYGVIITSGFNTSSFADTLAPADSMVVQVHFSASGFVSGVYHANLLFYSNDPLHPTVPLFCSLLLIGDPQIILTDTVHVFDSVMQFTSRTDTLTIYNQGCGYLVIDSLHAGLPQYTAAFIPGLHQDTIVPPRDSVQLIITFTPDYPGSYNTSLVIYNSDSDTSINIYGNCFGAPVCNPEPDTLFAQLNGCNDTVTVPVVLHNNGLGSMNWQTWYQAAGSCLHFTGGNQWVTFGDLGTVPDQGTIEFWTWTDIWSSFPNCFSTAGIDNTHRNVGFRFEINSSGNFTVVIGNDNNSTTTYTISSSLTKNTWHHVAVTWNKLTNQVWVYFDGNVVVNGNTHTRWSSRFFNVLMGVGYNSSRYWQGKMDEVRMWNLNRSLSEIQSTMFKKLSGLETGLRAYWNLNENSGSQVLDRTPNHHDGTFNGASWDYSIIPLQGFLTVTPDQGNTPAGDSSVISAVITGNGFISGTHDEWLVFQSNDPINPYVVIPVILELNGQASFTPSVDTLAFDTLMSGASQALNLIIYNHGCDTLVIDTISNSMTAFSISDTTPVYINPFSQRNLLVTFHPLLPGTYDDSLIFNTNIGNFSISMSGNAIGAATIEVDPDSLDVTFQHCGDSLITSVNISDPGDLPLQFHFVQFAEFFDDFENGLGKWKWNNQWGVTSYAYQGVRAMTESPNGNYGNGWNTSVTMKDSVYTDNPDSVILSYYTSYEMECNYDNFRVQISINNGDWQNIGTFTCSSAWVKHTFNLNTYLQAGDYFKIQFNFTTDGSVTADGVRIDNFRITGLSLMVPWLQLTLTGDTLEPGTNVNIPISIHSGTLNSGTYHHNLFIISNDPTAPITTFPVTMTIIGEPEMLPAPWSVNFGPVMKYTSSAFNFTIINSGCDTLSLDTLYTHLPEFSTAVHSGIVMPRDTVNIPVTFSPLTNGIFNDTLFIQSNDFDTIIPLSGIGTGAPVIGWSPDTLTAVTDCDNDTVTEMQVINTGDGDLEFDFGQMASLSSGLLFDYPFQGNYYDYSGNNRHLTNYGAIPDSGAENIPNSAYLFDSAYMAYTNVVDIQTNLFTSNASVSMWIRLPENFNQYTTQPYLFNICGNIGYYDGIRIYVNNGVLYATAYVNYSVRAVTYSVQFNQLFHMAVTHDGTFLRMYINGEKVSEVNATGSIIWYTNYPHLILGNHLAQASYNSPALAVLDEVRMYDRPLTESEIKWLYLLKHPAEWITVMPQTGTVIPGDQQAVFAYFDPEGLPSGINHGSILVSSNDPLHPLGIIPAVMTSDGSPEISVSTACIDFGIIMQFTTKTDSILIANNGCDTLRLDSLLTLTGSYIVGSYPPYIPPFRSIWVEVTFSPLVQEWNMDTLFIHNNDELQKVCLRGYCSAIPVIGADPNPMNIILACDMTGSLPLIVSNSGLAPLIFTVFIPPSSGWLSGPAGTDTLMPEEQKVLFITFNRGNLTTGLYSSLIQITSNDPLTPILNIPVYMLLPNPLVPVNIGDVAYFCTGSSVTLNAGSYSSYLWSTGDTTQTIEINSPGYYSVSVVDVYECESSDSVGVVELEYPIANAGSDTTVCSGYNLQLHAQSLNTQPPVPFEIVIGSGQNYTSNTGPNPFGTYYMDHRTQLLYRKSELISTGFNAGEIDALGFNINAVGYPAMQGFTISIGTTSLNSLNDYIPNLLTVYYSSSYLPVTGWNVFNLEEPFYWDGITNIVVQVCFDNSSYSSNSSFQYTDVTGRVFARYCDNCAPGCGMTSGYTYSQRANLKIIGVGDVTGFLWTGPNGFISHLRDPVISNISPTASGTYTLTVNNGYGCEDTDDISVMVTPSPIVNAGNNVTILSGQTITAAPSFSSGLPPYTFSWTPSTGLSNPYDPNTQMSPASTTTYTLAVTGADGCTGIDQVTITVIPRYPIGGQVTYNNAYFTALGDIPVYLKDNQQHILDSTTTDGNGNYEFPLNLEGEYNITAQSDQPTGGINATDALLIGRHIVGLQVLTGIRLSGADVNASNTITGADALLVLHHTVGNISTFPAGDWMFENKSINLSGGPAQVDFFGLCTGDVNGSHIPGLKSVPLVSLKRQGTVLTGMDEIIGVPVFTEHSFTTGAISLSFIFPVQYLEPISVTGGPGDWMFSTGKNELKVAWSNVSGYKADPSEPLMTLWFRRNNQACPQEEILLQNGDEAEIADLSGNIIRGQTLVIPRLLAGEALQDGFLLGQNRPNPFNDRTTIPYYIPGEGKVKLALYSLVGEQIIVLSDEIQAAGYHTYELARKDIPSGIYLYRLDYKGDHMQFNSTRRLVITH